MLLRLFSKLPNDCGELYSLLFWLTEVVDEYVVVLFFKVYYRTQRVSTICLFKCVLKIYKSNK